MLNKEEILEQEETLNDLKQELRIKENKIFTKKLEIKNLKAEIYAIEEEKIDIDLKINQIESILRNH